MSRFIKSKIDLHDSTQLQTAFDYYILDRLSASSGTKKQRYDLEIYLFFPPQLNISPETYSKDDFYSDLKPLLRLKSPRYSYKDSLPKMGTNGAYAEFVRLESWEPMAIPKSVSDEEATMCEPVAIAVRAIRNSQMKLGDSVAIIGSGPIGLLCMQVARAAGAGSIFVSEPAPARREVALQLGADMVIDPTTENPVGSIISATNGIGPGITSS